MADAAASNRRPENPRTERPLSPHLQIYRFSVTMFSSIFHRFTGIGLGAGTLLVAWWVIAAAIGPDAYADFTAVAGHWFGRLVLLGLTVAFIFHLLNGVRHLFWDAGLGFEKPTARFTGWLVVTLTGLLTVAVWVAAYASMGKL
ncbi:MAG: succinate dehydrogenase, cytochrome b556 subunit [Micropepsaceae bacterium]